MRLSPSFKVLSNEDVFPSLVEDFNLAAEGLANHLLKISSDKVNLVPKQMLALLNDLSFEFYNFYDEFKERQGLSTLYYLSFIFGRHFLKAGEKVIIIKGYTNALLFQQILRHLLKIEEDLILVNTHSINSTYQRYVDDVAESLLVALKPVDQMSMKQLNDFKRSLERIIVYLKRKSRAVTLY